MSNLDQYLELWQQKRNELTISYDVQADWTDMHDLLDQQMPIVNPDAGNASSNSSANVANQLSHFAKFKLIYVVAALLTVAAITYLLVKHRAATKNNKHQKTELRKDSVSNSKANAALINNRIADSVSNNAPLANNTASINNDSTANTASNTNVVDKNNKNAAGNAGINKIIAEKSNNNTPGKPLSKSNPAAGIVNDLNRPSATANTNRSRLLASANNIKNGLVLNNHRASNSARQGRSNTNNTGLSGNNGAQITNNDGQIEGDKQSVIFNADDKALHNTPQTYIVPLQPPPFIFNADANLLINNYTTAGMAKATADQKNKNRIGKPPVTKTTKDKTATGSNLDWGILVGADSKGSFTPKAQNHNVYGSLSPDIYVGLFGTYNFNQRWAFGLQGRFLTPHNLSGSYKYTKTSKTSHGLDSVNTIQIKDSRKIYTVDIPLYLIYKPTSNLNLKAGPMLSIPVKMVNRSSTFVVDSTVFNDTAKNAINNTRFEKKIRYGISAGVGFNYKRLLFDATYNYNFQKQKVSSSLGGYTANTNGLQLTIGFKFNKSKK